MKTKMKIMLATLALGASAFVAGAQDDNGGPPPDGQGQGGHHRPPPLPLVMALDVNHDHVIDANEISNASAELLTLDKNGDGVLTTNEYLPQRPPQNGNSSGKNFQPPTPMIVCALDANHDGVIDAKEIANAPVELKTLDKNGDGQLTPDEFIGPRPSNAGRGDDNGAPPGPPPDQQ
jgi:EF hand